jgi:hypothetical protein
MIQKLILKPLKEDWIEQEDKMKKKMLEDNIRNTITRIAEDEERIKTLWLYTGGQPVRLALYTDLIIEDWIIPERLQDRHQEAELLSKDKEALD